MLLLEGLSDTQIPFQKIVGNNSISKKYFNINKLGNYLLRIN